MAGYSGTPLAQKIGFKPGQRVAVLDAPDDLPTLLAPLPPGLALHARVAAGPPYDLIWVFVAEARKLTQRFATLAPRLTANGAFWVSWPKTSAGVATDVTEDVARAIGLKAGLVDVKVCAVDATWSGLKFVYRLKDRPRHGLRATRGR